MTCKHDDISINDFQVPYKVYCYTCKEWLKEEVFKKLPSVQKAIRENRERNKRYRTEAEYHA
ncbi:MAG: hypothetical protein ACW98D_19205 [Promethearchaeota archaeon]